jgi:hypothetical protein
MLALGQKSSQRPRHALAAFITGLHPLLSWLKPLMSLGVAATGKLIWAGC